MSLSSSVQDGPPTAAGFAVREVSWSDAGDARSRSSSAAGGQGRRAPSSYSTLSSKSTFSRLTFSWVNSLMAIGSARGHLEHADLEELVGQDSTEYLSSLFERVWTEEVDTAREFNRKARWKAWRIGAVPKRREPSLLRALFTCFGWRYLSLGLLKLLSDCLMFSGPVLLGYLVTFVESYEQQSTTPPETPWHGYLYAGGLVAGVLLSAIANTQYTFAIRRVGLYLRAVVVTAVFRKALRISNTARRDFSAGNINNVMSVDTDRVTDIAISVHEFWSLPVQVGIALYLLYREISWSLLAGLSVVVLLIPLNAYIMNRINLVSKAMMRFKDQRIGLLDEVIRHIRTIKYMALETRFARRVLEVRALEMGQLAIRKYLDALCVYFWATTPILVSLATFATYSYLLGHTLTSAKVFSSLALFQLLTRPLNSFPWIISGLIEGRVSALRVYDFLKAAEFGQEDDDEEEEPAAKDWTVAQSSYRSPAQPAEVKEHIVSQPHDPSRCVVCIQGTFDYILPKSTGGGKSVIVDVASSVAMSPMASAPRLHALEDLHLHVYRGECIGIYGPVGASKTTLLLGMLGELSQRSKSPGDGRTLHGRVAFVSQEVWLPNATVREQILFHSPFDADRYARVLHACALQPDLDVFPAGDRTEVGEASINISGGQSMRLSLARACYSQADIFLFDDPISSVDAHVGAHILKHVFGRTGLLRHATRILVTHQPQLIRPHADRMWRMERGRVVEEERITHTAAEEKAIDAQNTDDGIGLARSASNLPRIVDAGMLEEKLDEEAEKRLLEKGYLTEEESRARGSIRSRVLKAYLRFVGWFLCGVIVLSMFLMQGSRNACDYWLSYWVEQVSRQEQDGQGDQDASDAHYYLRIFAYLAAGNSAAALFRSFIFAYGGLRAARQLFTTLLHSVLFAPIVFFDVNPVGRILNRFSSDVNSIDESIPFLSNIFLAQLFMLIGALGVIAAVVPAVLLLLPALAFIYFRIQKAYRGVSRELRRLDSTSRSPLYAQFSETITGVTLIRAFGLERVFQAKNEQILDANQKVQMANLGTSNWLNLRLQTIGCSMITLVAFMAIISCLYPTDWLKHIVNPSMIGLGIAYALPLTDVLNGVIGSATDTEKEVVSVERTVEYIRIQPEDEEDTDSMRDEDAQPRRRKAAVGINEDLESALLDDSTVSSSLARRVLAAPIGWPSRGQIDFVQVSLSYRADLPPALREVSFTIPAGQRCGIVGRTGSGKTSLLAALFRMRELNGGRISLDGVDISTLARREVRSRLAIIPQAPVLFSGTVRANLLPYDEECPGEAKLLTDEQIWTTLRQCHMADKIRSLPEGLSTLLTSGSSQLSVGERQLLCFARALLTGARVIALDESTASIDQQSDALIQTMLATQLSGVTILAIAHRLATVLSFDKILVMDGGRVAEFGVPRDLLQKPESALAALVEATGATSARQLREMASAGDTTGGAQR